MMQSCIYGKDTEFTSDVPADFLLFSELFEMFSLSRILLCSWFWKKGKYRDTRCIFHVDKQQVSRCSCATNHFLCGSACCDVFMHGRLVLTSMLGHTSS